MADDYFGHRNPFTGEPQGNPDEWIEWDHFLVTADETIEAHTDQHGLFRWETVDDAVIVNAVRKIDKFEEAKTLITSVKGYKPRAGEYFVPEVKSRRSSGEIQTFPEYLEAQYEKAGLVE